MRISFSPVEGMPAAAISVDGDVITINGTPYDFSALLEGEIVPMASLAEPLIVSDATRTDGVIVLTVILGNAPEASEAARYPDVLVVTEAGDVTLPE